MYIYIYTYAYNHICVCMYVQVHISFYLQNNVLNQIQMLSTTLTNAKLLHRSTSIQYQRDKFYIVDLRNLGSQLGSSSEKLLALLIYGAIIFHTLYENLVVYMYVYIYIYIHTYIHICMYVCMYIYAYNLICICIYRFKFKKTACLAYLWGHHFPHFI